MNNAFMNVSGSEHRCWKILGGLNLLDMVRGKFNFRKDSPHVCINHKLCHCGIQELEVRFTFHLLSTDLKATREKTRGVCWGQH